MNSPNSLENITLLAGNHASPEDGLCAMEAVAWLAGEVHSDAPECTCPVLAAYVRKLNDIMPEEKRQELKVFLLKLIGTKKPALEQKRAEVLAWAAVTRFAP